MIYKIYNNAKFDSWRGSFDPADLDTEITFIWISKFWVGKTLKNSITLHFNTYWFNENFIIQLPAIVAYEVSVNYVLGYKL